MADYRRTRGYVKSVKEVNQRKKRKSKVFASQNRGKLLHLMGKAAGLLVMLIGALAFFVLWLRNSHHGIGLTYVNFFCLMIFLAGFALYLCAYNAARRMIRFRYYRTFLEDREYIGLDEMAQITGRKVKFLQTDLWKMIQNKLFLQGNFNEQGSFLFLTEDAYNRYIRGELILMNQDVAEESVQTAEETPAEDRDKPPAEPVEEFKQAEGNTDFEEICDQHLICIETLIHDIGEKTVKADASSICVRGKQIMFYRDTVFHMDVERFLLYYLPTVSTLLETYAEVEKEGMADQTVDLKDMLTTIKHSFDTFAEKLFEGKKMDVEADIADNIWRNE